MVLSMMTFLKKAYGRAKDADKFLISQQPPASNEVHVDTW
jgi:hypothetical protein